MVPHFSYVAQAQWQQRGLNVGMLLLGRTHG